MVANAPNEQTVLREALTWLRARLPHNWELDTRGADDSLATALRAQPNGSGWDGQIYLRSGSSFSPMVVETKTAMTPREARDLLSPLARRLRNVAGRAPVLVVAPWMSERAREILREAGINYLDLTGNAWISLDNPALYIETSGALRNPNPRQQGGASLRGAKAGRLVRLLADVRPPFGIRELASAAALAPGYVSQLVQMLESDALLERNPRGTVERVDVPRLLRLWSQSYSVLKSNRVSIFATGIPLQDLLDRTAGDAEADWLLTITGSFAARRYVSVARPALLLAYSLNPAAAASQLGLLPVAEGANVILLEPFDQVAEERLEYEDGQRFAALSQVAVDCATGNGRMPAEGDALLEWIAEHGSEAQWAGIGSLPGPDD